LRVALIGVLAYQKGAVSVMNVAAAADRNALSLHLIGYIERDLPSWLADSVDSTGEYKEAELPALLAKAKPHVAWFPSQWPETYSSDRRDRRRAAHRCAAHWRIRRAAGGTATHLAG